MAPSIGELRRNDWPRAGAKWPPMASRLKLLHQFIRPAQGFQQVDVRLRMAGFSFPLLDAFDNPFAREGDVFPRAFMKAAK